MVSPRAFNLRTLLLNGAVSIPRRGASREAATRGLASIRPRAAPVQGPVAAADVHVAQPAEQAAQRVLGDVGGYVGHRGARVRQVVETDFEHGGGRVAGARRKLLQQGVTRREAAGARRGIGDLRHRSLADFVHRHHAFGVEPIPVAHLHAGALPGPVGDGDRAARYRLVKRTLEEHSSETRHNQYNIKCDNTPASPAAQRRNGSALPVTLPSAQP